MLFNMCSDLSFPFFSSVQKRRRKYWVKPPYLYNPSHHLSTHASLKNLQADRRTVLTLQHQPPSPPRQHVYNQPSHPTSTLLYSHYEQRKGCQIRTRKYVWHSVRKYIGKFVGVDELIWIGLDGVYTCLELELSTLYKRLSCMYAWMDLRGVG